MTALTSGRHGCARRLRRRSSFYHSGLRSRSS